MHILRLVAAIAASMSLSACASIVSDNTSTTYLDTDPEKARCELHGQDFKRVVETPNSISLPAKAAPLTISCSADGYKTASGNLDTEMDGWIFGNLIFGGIVGVVVDVARGAGQKFPPKMTVVLEPERFADTTRRDAFYARRKALSEEKWARVINDTQNQCSAGVPGDCSERVKQLQDSRDKELAKIEERRLSSTVTSSPLPEKTSALSPSTAHAAFQSSEETKRADRSTPPDASIERQLKYLKNLLDDGLITQNDYEVRKSRLLDRL
jgi:hypothetical protein